MGDLLFYICRLSDELKDHFFLFKILSILNWHDFVTKPKNLECIPSQIEYFLSPCNQGIYFHSFIYPLIHSFINRSGFVTKYYKLETWICNLELVTVSLKIEIVFKHSHIKLWIFPCSEGITPLENKIPGLAKNYIMLLCCVKMIILEITYLIKIGLTWNSFV